MKLRPAVSFGISLLLAVSTMRAGDDAAKNAPPPSAEQNELLKLKARLAEQQAQIEKLRKALDDQSQALDKIANHVEDAAPALPTYPGTGEIASTRPIVPPASTSAPVAQDAEDAPSPLQLRIGDAAITPVGFMDLTNVWRSAGTGAGIGTNFGSIPYNNTVPGRLTEDTFSAQNSRLGLRVDANVLGAHILGYMEGDFLGFAPTNAEVTSNSMTFRMRLYWADVRKDWWEVLAGQSWSLMTPNRKGLSPLPSDIFYTQDMDTNYQLGLVWARQPGFRFVVHPSAKVALGVALEQPQQYIGGAGGSAAVVLPAALSASNYSNEVNNGTTTTSVPNLAPDIIAKLAFDPNSRVHVEIAGLERTFKTYYQPSNQYFTKTGAGGSLNASFEIVKGLRLLTNNYWSDGGGRYIYGQAPDFIVAANGAPLLVHAGSTLDGFEAQMKNTLFYGYYGGAYIGRETARDVNNALIGWGYAGSANSQNRSLQEGTIGITQNLWKNARYGALSLITQYSYAFRNPWFDALNAPKDAHMNMFFVDLRYTLPGTAPTIKY